MTIRRMTIALASAAMLLGATASPASAQTDIEADDITTGYNHVDQPPPGFFSTADWCFSFTNPDLIGEMIEVTAAGPSGAVEGTGTVGADRTSKVRVGINEGGIYTVTSIVVLGVGDIVVPDDVASIDVVFDPEIVDCFEELFIAPDPVDEEVPESTALTPESTPAPASEFTTATTLAPSTAPSQTVAPTEAPTATPAGIEPNPEPTTASPGDESDFPWWIVILISIILILIGVWKLTHTGPKPGADDPTDGDPEMPGGELDDLEDPPDIFMGPIEIAEAACDWGAKYAKVVDGTYKVSTWHPIRSAKATECARYEVMVVSTLHVHTVPTDTDKEKQVSYRTGMWPFRSTWWQTMRHVEKALLTSSNPFATELTVRVKDAVRSRTKSKSAGAAGGGAPATRGQTERLEEKLEYRESLYIRIKLEPGPHKACFPGGAAKKHEFWATGASSSAGKVMWRCAHSSQYKLWASCGNSSPKGLNIKVGGSVKSKQLKNFNYPLVSQADVKAAVTAKASTGFDPTFTLEPKTSVNLGPLALGSFSASIPSSHEPHAAQGFLIRRPAPPEVQTVDEVAVSCDMYIEAGGSIESHKSDDWDQSVRADINGSIRHAFHIIGRTDDDAPCACCRPGIDFELKSQGNGPGATIKVGTETIELAHPGWKDGTGWAKSGTTRAWTISKTTSTKPEKKT